MSQASVDVFCGKYIIFANIEDEISREGHIQIAAIIPIPAVVLSLRSCGHYFSGALRKIYRRSPHGIQFVMVLCPPSSWYRHFFGFLYRACVPERLYPIFTCPSVFSHFGHALFSFSFFHFSFLEFQLLNEV